MAWFTHRYFPCVGGSEGFGRAIVRRLVEAGHEVDVFTSDAQDLWYFTDPTRRRTEAPAESMVDGATVHRFPIRHRPLQRYVGRLLSYVPHWPTRCCYSSYMPIIPGLRRVRGPYDAVFALGFPYTIFSYAAYETAQAAGAPLILTPFLHLATPGDVVNRHYTRPHQIRLLAAADCVVVQTKLEADAVASWGVPRERILLLGMAMERAEVTGGDRASARRLFGVPERRTTIGHLATLNPNKGTMDLIRAVARLNARRPASDPVHLILAGQTSPEFEQFLVDEPAWRTTPWLTLAGEIERSQVAGFFAASDIFAMPSRTDSFGIVFLEAWANGLPVVGAAAGGVPDVVDDGRTGHLVPFGDVERLASVLGDLADDPAAAHAMGEAGRAHVDRGFTWDDRYATLMDRVGALLRARRPA